MAYKLAPGILYFGIVHIVQYCRRVLLDFVSSVKKSTFFLYFSVTVCLEFNQ